MANASEQFEGLLGYELIPAQSAYSRWDRATRESISRATGKVSFRDFKFPNGDPFAQHVLTMKSAFNRPTTYVFRTREGAMGVLQFVNRDDPNGFVKFRYKLAQAEAKADASPWGDAVEGVQCRLRADKLVWQAGETPTFSVDARWNGTAMAFGHGDAMLELQFDGQWYDIAIDDHAVDRLSLDSPWFRSERGRVVRPALTSGKHVVRAAILGAVSNPVEIEIREADGAKSAARLMFHGLDLAAAPRSTKSADLPDLWEEQPPGSRSYHIRKEVKVVYSGLVGTVYHVPAKGVFYIQHDRLGSSTRTYYGPFKGDLAQVLKLDAERAAWGQTVNGLQLGLSFDLQDRAYQVGELVSFVVHVRNVGDELVTLVDFTGTAPEADRAYLMGWAPTVRDGAGKRLRVATPPIDHPVQTRRRTLLPGEFMPIGVILLRIDAGPEDRATAPHLQLEPGNYHVSQTYRFAQHEKAAWSGELTTGELSLRVVPIESE